MVNRQLWMIPQALLLQLLLVMPVSSSSGNCTTISCGTQNYPAVFCGFICSDDQSLYYPNLERERVVVESVDQNTSSFKVSGYYPCSSNSIRIDLTLSNKFHFKPKEVETPNSGCCKLQGGLFCPGQCSNCSLDCLRNDCSNFEIEFEFSEAKDQFTFHASMDWDPDHEAAAGPSTALSSRPQNESAPCAGCSSGCNCRRKSSLKKVFFIAGGFACFGAAVLLLLVVLLVLRRRKLTRRSSYNSGRAHFLEEAGGPYATCFSLKALKVATKSFAESRLLGGGGFSTVYQGKLADGRTVAVKKLNQGNKQGVQQFQNEVIILSKVKHVNLVQLLGYCVEGREMLLVYEYLPNGTLADHLHGDKGKGRLLPLETRLNIALETAKALAYLHFYVVPPIYHRDVKSSNILLDNEFRVKVADFGLSRLTHVDASNLSTAPQGTPGYLDPDYHESYQLTDKSDVYSFGVVLLELVSRKKAVDMSRDKKEINLASMALARIHSGALHELFDPQLSVKYWKVLTRLVEVAFRCLAAEKDDRPTMLEVVASLEQINGAMLESHRVSQLQMRNSNSGSMRRNSSSGEAVKKRSDYDSPTSVQIKWPSTHTSPNHSRSDL